MLVPNNTASYPRRPDLKILVGVLDAGYPKFGNVD